MTEEDPKEVQPTFLKDETILPYWNTRFSIHRPDQGSTKLVEGLGLESINQKIGKYRIIASAAKYVADIGHMVSYEEKATVVREMFFNGRIAIYKQGIIHDTEVDGWEIATEGFIWTATPNEEQFRGSDGLRNLVLGAEPTEEKISSIIQGYAIQEEQMRREQSRREQYNIRATRHQGQREGPVFSSGPC